MLAVAVLSTATAGVAQTESWPDGEYIGFFNGGGQAAGSFEGFTFSGTAAVGGGFSLDIVDGEAKGDYLLIWSGTGTSAGDTGSQTIEEVGDIEGVNGSVSLIRRSANVEVVAQGITLPLPPQRLSPSPSELQITHNECGLIEGVFQSKLAGLENAFKLFGIDADSEEGFSALRLTGVTDAEVKDALTRATKRMSEISKEFLFLVGDAQTDLKGAIADAEDLMADLEAVLADLEGLSTCGGDFDTKTFRLGITKTVSRFIEAVLNIALEDGNAEAVLRLAALSARSASTGEVTTAAQKVVSLLVDDAAAAKDLGALTNLLLAAMMFGLLDEVVRIEAEIGAIRGTS